jgi:hypothetical protein
MAASTQQTEAIKLISDWCKWFATIETFAIAAIGSALKRDSGWTLTWPIVVLCGITIFSFILSIILAAMALSSLPEAVQDIATSESVWDRQSDTAGFRRPLWWVVTRQLGLFVVGLIAFSIAVIWIAISAATAHKSQTSNQAIQRTASRAAIDVVSDCHPPVHCESRFTGLAVADLRSR